MNTEQTEIEIARGNGAIELLRQLDPYFDEVDEALIDGFRNHPSTDASGLQAIKMQLSALAALRQKLTTVIETGIMASKAKEH